MEGRSYKREAESAYHERMSMTAGADLRNACCLVVTAWYYCFRRWL